MLAQSASDRPGAFARISAAVIRWALSLRIVRSFLLYSERGGPMLADAVTYRALFSVFAGVLLGFSIAALWLAGNEQAWNAVVDAVDAAVPGLIGTIVDPDEIAAPAGLTIAGAISLVGLIGSALGAIGSLRTALRTIAGTVGDDVMWLWVILRNLALALAIGVSFLASAALTFVGETIVRAVADATGAPADSPAVFWGVRLISLLAVLVLDAGLILLSFRLLSGLRPRLRSLLAGAALGAAGLIVLQELSGLFVRGAGANPLLATFASLLALLLWLNLSTQVILIASSYITTAEEERHDRVRARFGAETFVQRRLQRAEQDVEIAQRALRAAQDAASGA